MGAIFLDSGSEAGMTKERCRISPEADRLVRDDDMVWGQFDLVDALSLIHPTAA